MGVVSAECGREHGDGGAEGGARQLGDTVAPGGCPGVGGNGGG